MGIGFSIFLDLFLSVMNDLTAFRRDLLVVIAGLDKPHGLAVKEELEKYYEGEVNHGRLYPNLDSLADEGYIEKGELDDRTNYYTINESGKEVISERVAWEEQYIDR